MSTPTFTYAPLIALIAGFGLLGCSGGGGESEATGTSATTGPSTSATQGSAGTDGTDTDGTDTDGTGTDGTSTDSTTATTTSASASATDPTGTGETDTDTGETDTGDPPKPALYVSLDGDDNNPGTYDMPLRTFDAALAGWQPGWEIRVFGGTWNERLDVPDEGTADDPIIILPVEGEAPILDGDGLEGGQPLRITGRYVHVGGFEVHTSDNQCVDVDGDDVVLENLRVHDCVSHGVQLGGAGITARGLTIYNTVLENEGEQGSWGSGLKVKVGGQGILLERNHVYKNWGEGIAVTRGVDAVVRQNWSHDNYAVNIYIDNSNDVLVEGNLTTCDGTGPLKDGNGLPVGVMLGEEYYDGWGPQLHDVTIQNNLIAFCGYGIGWWGAEIDGGGLQRISILHNTIWGGSETGISISYDAPKTENSVIANNLVQQPDDAVAWIEDRTGLDMHHNFWVGPVPDDWRQCDGDGDLNGDPGLGSTPDYTAASFRLGEGSAARDAAAVLAEVPTDFEGRERVTGDSPGADVGAMEYGDPADPAEFDSWWD
ncbi:MAG: right-handed parallel beta-helix repeat-containing protein [Myxococcales bacterium]|nr:right-handed parallel beta-helix repeat-containing protein [Myxococcales bacterium]